MPECNCPEIFNFVKSAIFRTRRLLRTRSVNHAVVLTHTMNAALNRSGFLRSGITRYYSKKPSNRVTTRCDEENQVFLTKDCDRLQDPFTSLHSSFVNESSSVAPGEMKALKCKPSVFAYSYSINMLSKYSSLISHRPSMFEGRLINHRSSKVDTSIIGLRRSTHPSPKVDTSKVDTSISEGRHIVTSIFEGRHIDIRKSTHRSSKVDASIFEDRRRKHHTYNSSSNIVHNCAPKSLDPWSRRSYTRSFCSYIH